MGGSLNPGHPAIVTSTLQPSLNRWNRRPAEETDPACALPTLPEFIRAIKDAEAFNSKHIPAFSMGTETWVVLVIQSSECEGYALTGVPDALSVFRGCRSALDMDDAMMDAYIEFCEKALLPREDRIPGTRIIGFI